MPPHNGTLGLYHLAFKVIVANGQESKPCNRPVRKRSCKLILCQEQRAHGPHHLEPALRERSLEAVSLHQEAHDCAHRSDATLGKRSFKAVAVNIEQAKAPQPLEPTPRERSLEAVLVDHDNHDCAHWSDAALWNRSLEAVYADRE
eukprot:5520094-Amphidinium_carterae.1